MDVYRCDITYGDYSQYNEGQSTEGGEEVNRPGGSTSQQSHEGNVRREPFVAASLRRVPADSVPSLDVALHYAPPPPEPAEAFELQIIVDFPYDRNAPSLQVSIPSSLASSGLLISEGSPRRTSPPPAPWQRTWPSTPPPGYYHLLNLSSMGETAPAEDPSPPPPQEEDSDDEDFDPEHELLSLALRLEIGETRGLSREEIDKLPSFPFESSSPDKMSCVVCMSDFEKEQTLRKLPCSHVFHSTCVDKWFKGKRTCPICRRDAAEDSSKELYNTD